MRFDIDFAFDAGGARKRLTIASDAPLVALVGPSGIGKTTALDCIAALRKPASGHIAISGRELIGLPPEARHAGYVFQDLRLFDHMDVGDNIRFGSGRRNGPPEDALEIIAMLDIGHLMDRYPANLSGGEARRVALARALLSNPQFLLLDEPLASLDAERADRIATLIEDIRDRLSIPILLVSHAQAEVARLAGEVVSLTDEPV